MSRRRYVHFPSGRVVIASQVNAGSVFCGESLVPEHAAEGDWWVEVDHRTDSILEKQIVGRSVPGSARTRRIVSDFVFQHEFAEQKTS